MDPNSTNTAPSVPASPAAPAGDTSAAPLPSQPTPPAQEAAPNPLTATPSIPMGQSAPSPTQTPQPAQPVQPTLPAAHHKGKPMIWVILLLLFSFFCGLLLAAWYFQTQLQKATPGNQTAQVPVATPKTIVVGTDATFQPMEYIASGGAMMGYDIDLGNRIAEEMKAKVTFKNIAWDNLFTALAAKQVDMIISSVVISDEGKQQYDFSDSYLEIASASAKSSQDKTGKQYGIVFRKGDPNRQKINDILSALRAQGILTDLKQKWLD